MKLSHALFALAVFITNQTCYASNTSWDQSRFFQDVGKNRSSHPVQAITAHEGHEHLRGFPTFVEITEKGSAVMMQQGTAQLSFFARFSGLDEPVRLYNLNHYFFTRAKAPGLYQPDYPVYAADEGFYYPGVSIMDRQFRKNGMLVPFLHGLNFLPGPESTSITIYNPECDFHEVGNLLNAAKGELTHLSGHLRYGSDAPFLDSEDYAGEIPFQSDIRGVVFTIDGVDDACMFQLKIRALSWSDYELLKLKNELKIRIK